MPTNFYDMMQAGKQDALSDQDTQRDNQTRNAYADAMQQGGDQNAFAQQAQKLGKAGNVKGQDFLTQRIVGMDEAARKKYLEVAQKSGGVYQQYMNDLATWTQKLGDPNAAIKKANESYAAHYLSLDDDGRKHLAPYDKMNPFIAMKGLSDAGLLENKINQINQTATGKAMEEGIKADAEMYKADASADARKYAADKTAGASTYKTDKTDENANKKVASKYADTIQKRFEKIAGTKNKQAFVQTQLDQIDADLEDGEIDDNEALRRQKAVKNLMGGKTDVKDGPVGKVSDSWKDYLK